jgi:transposase
VLLAFVGPPPTGQFCRHKNGNPGDDRLENLEYALFENRLTEEAVVQIRLERKNGASGKELADKYGVEESTIYGVCLGKVYAWCDGPLTEPYEIRGGNRNLKISDEDAVEIYHRVKGGETRTAIAEEFSVCIKTISKIADGKREATKHLAEKEKNK